MHRLNNGREARNSAKRPKGAILKKATGKQGSYAGKKVWHCSYSLRLLGFSIADSYKYLSVTAPSDADVTVAAYFASTPRV